MTCDTKWQICLKCISGYNVKKFNKTKFFVCENYRALYIFGEKLIFKRERERERERDTHMVINSHENSI